MRYWPKIEPVRSREQFRMPARSQIEPSKGCSFFMVLELGGALGTERPPTVKTETGPKYELHTGDAMIGRPRVKTELSMSGDQRREQRCP